MCLEFPCLKRAGRFLTLKCEECSSTSRSHPDETLRTDSQSHIRWSKSCVRSRVSCKRQRLASITQYIINEKLSGLLGTLTVWSVCGCAAWKVWLLQQETDSCQSTLTQYNQPGVHQLWCGFSFHTLFLTACFFWISHPVRSKNEWWQKSTPASND